MAMNRNGVMAAGLVLAALSGTAGYWMGRQSVPAAPVVPPVAPVATAPVALPDDTVLALRAKIAGLEQTLADLRSRPSAAEPVMAEPVVAAEATPPEPPARTERSRRDDPERAAAMAKMRESFEARMRTNATQRAEFYKSLDPSKMTEAHRVHYEKLMAAVASLQGAVEARQAGQEVDRAVLFQQMNEIRGLYEEERRYLLEDAARSIGYADSEAGGFADYVSSIYDNTSIEGFFRGMGLSRGGRGAR